MQWAEQGDSNKVDNTLGDVRGVSASASEVTTESVTADKGEKEETQAYSSLNKLDSEIPCFCFGKCAEQPSGVYEVKSMKF